MAYGKKYEIPFLNIDARPRRIDLLLKDYDGPVDTLTGAADPFILSYTSGDDNIINPIRASECTINFFNDGNAPLITFYSEDDSAWKIEFYADDALTWAGFVVQDDCSEQLLDPPYQVQLKGTDNIALLKDVPFNEAWASSPINDFNIISYTQAAASNADGIMTLGVSFIAANHPIVDFQAGSSPYQDLAGFNLATNDDRWILKNGTTAKDFHLTGTIDVIFTGFAENFRWLVQKNNGTIIDLVPNQLIPHNVRTTFTFDVTVTLQPGERLFAMGASQGNFANDKQYFQTTWNFAIPFEGTTSITAKMPLMDYIKYSILKTGLALPLQIFSNLYEDSEQDRGDNITAEMFLQTHLFSGMFIGSDGEWQSCYEVIETIMFALNATFMQQKGTWTIIRFPEINIYSVSNQIPGNKFAALNFDTPVQVTYHSGFFLNKNSDMYFINADQRRSILRPLKSTKYTFNFEQPKELIHNSDLQFVGALDHSTTIGDFRYDYYAIPGFWLHIDGDTSLIVIVTDLTTNTETERYIYSPKFGDQFRFLRMNPVEVSGGDVFDFICSYRHETATSQDDWFSIRYLLITPGNTYYFLRGFIGKGADFQPVQWAGPFPMPGTADDVVSIFIDGGTDPSEWQPYSLARIQQTAGPKYTIPSIPEDGVLLIDIAGGNNTDPSLTDVEMLIKSLELKFTFRLNKSTDIIGQNHTTELANDMKNVLAEETKIDDSPRNTIAGTLFTSALTSFAETIGSINFTKTKKWHRYPLAESRRLGEITTMEREQMQSVVRTKIECTIKYDEVSISPADYMWIDEFPDLKFIFGVVEFNYMQGTLNATLWELFKSDEVNPAFNYEFKYLYEKT